jgi:hypothetical protein
MWSLEINHPMPIANQILMIGFWGAHAPSRVDSSALAGNFFACCSPPIRCHPTPVAKDSHGLINVHDSAGQGAFFVLALSTSSATVGGHYAF